MKWWGLTGGIATGKSTVADILRKQDVPVISSDSLAREVVLVGSPGLKEVVKAFGEGILNSKGEMAREKLGQIVFADAAQRKKLESILHPLIRERANQIRKELEKKKTPLAVSDVPLLYEVGMEKQFDGVAVVYASLENQKIRLRSRDKMSDLEIKNRMAAQMSIEEKKTRADFVIANEGSLGDLELQVQKFLEFVRKSRG